MNALVEERRVLLAEADELRTALSAREQRVRELEAQVLDANQRRQDTGKCLDELISQLDQLDAQLAGDEA